MSVLYDSAMYAREPVNSYWEATAPYDRPDAPPLAGDQKFDVAIIGGGFTGLSTALHLVRDHHISACVLDAGHMGWGASGRNGGLVGLYAAKLEVETMVSRYGLDETRRFFSAQVEGIELVKELCDSEGIDCDRVGEGNFEVAHIPSALQGLKDYARSLTDKFGIPTRVYDRPGFADIGYDSEEQYGGMFMEAGFGVHPLKLTLGLAQAAQRRGAILYSHSQVTGWNRRGQRHVLTTDAGSVEAGRIVVATNGFTREGVQSAFDHRLMPVISNIITTRPLTRDELDAHQWATLNPVCNTRKLLFYYRVLPDNSFLFGARGDTRGDVPSGKRMQALMERRLGQVFPYWKHVEISHYWRGLVCMSRKRTPSIGRLADDTSVFYGFGYHGNGINTAPWAGKLISRMIAADDDGGGRIPAMCRGMPLAFPMPGLRLWYLRAAYQYYKLTDYLF